jgi:uncharacterized repeat protein (TIGR01451 family)
MGFRSWIHGAIGVALVSGVPSAGASDVRLPRSGRVTLEFLDGRDAFPSTLAVAAPGVAVAASGCRAEDAVGLPGRRLVTAREAQRGCRVALDADPEARGVQPFPAGTTFNFRLCVQTDPSPACENVWSSRRASNGDGAEHLRTVRVSDRILRLGWEHQAGGAGADFDDHIVVLRIDGDRDGDGLWDDWETSGIDADGDGDVDLALPGADPDHKDVFVELDWMDCALDGGDCPADRPHDHQPRFGAIEEVQAVYAAAPVDNPDGRTGIKLHVELDERLPHRQFLDLGCFGQPSFAPIKASHFADARRFAYHYGIFGHSQQEGDHGNAGCAEVGGDDFLVTLADWSAIQRQTVDRLHAGSLLHELGHNLGLRHGGGDNVDLKPNYLSVMNHRYQYRGIPPHGTLDYSRTVLPTLDERNVDERRSLPAAVMYACPDLQVMCVSKPGGDINWNCARGIEDDRLVLDLNRDRFCIRPRGFELATCAEGGEQCDVDDQRELVRQVDATGAPEFFEWYSDGQDRTCDLAAHPDDEPIRAAGSRQPRRLRGFSDWDNLRYAFQADLDHGHGSEISVQEEIEADLDEELVILRFTASPQVVPAGALLTFTATLKNVSEFAIDNGVVEETVPPGTRLVSCTIDGRDCPSASGAIVGGALPHLEAQQEAVLRVAVRVPGSTPAGTRLRSQVRAEKGGITPDVECLPGERYAPFQPNRAALSILVRRP